jgi:hypothetical protein
VRRFILRWTVIACCAVAWWLWGVSWVDQQGTNHAVLLYLILGIIGGMLHFYALYRFNRMVRNVRKDETLGLADSGSTGFALNQRFRYIMRSAEALLIITVAVFGLIGLQNTGFVRTALYIKTVFTYLIGSVVVTAYLTWRDLRVINMVRKNSSDDAATLRPILRYKSGAQHEKEMEDGD